MALIAEDGSAVANAESYCSVAFADDYHRVRGNDAWAFVAADSDKEAALRLATDYLEARYGTRWQGARVTDTQALSWPRGWVPLPQGYAYYPYVSYYLPTQIPAAVQRACCELALRSLTDDLMPDLGRLQSRVTIGPITTEYVQGAPAVKRYRQVESLLAPLLIDSGSGIQLIRS